MAAGSSRLVPLQAWAGAIRKRMPSPRRRGGAASIRLFPASAQAGCEPRQAPLDRPDRAVSSAVERFVYTEDVGSSILSPPTTLRR